MPEKKRVIVFSEATAEKLLKLYDEGYEKDKEVSYNPDGPENMKVYYLVRFSDEERVEQMLSAEHKTKDVVIDQVQVPIEKHADREEAQKKGEKTIYQQYIDKGYRPGHSTSSVAIMEFTEKTTGDYLVDFVIKFCNEHGLDEKEVMKVLVAAVKAASPEEYEEPIDLPPTPIQESHSGQGAEMIAITVTDEQVKAEKVKDVIPIEDMEGGIPSTQEKPLVFKKATGETVKSVDEYDVELLGCDSCHMDDTCRAKSIHFMTLKRENLHMCPMHVDYDKTKPPKAKPKEKAVAEEPLRTPLNENQLGCPSCAKGCDAETKQVKWDEMEAAKNFGCGEWEYKQ